MPIFEYKCQSCGTVSDILVGVTAEQPEVACAECGGTDVVKLISRFSTVESRSRFPIAGDCACAAEGQACACGLDGAGCGCSADDA